MCMCESVCVCVDARVCAECARSRLRPSPARAVRAEGGAGPRGALSVVLSAAGRARPPAPPGAGKEEAFFPRLSALRCAGRAVSAERHGRCAGCENTWPDLGWCSRRVCDPVMAESGRQMRPSGVA